MIINRGRRIVTDTYLLGELFEVKGDDSYFKGNLVCVFPKRSGKLRCVLENSDGLLHIYALKQLERVDNEGSGG